MLHSTHKESKMHSKILLSLSLASLLLFNGCGGGSTTEQASCSNISPAKKIIGAANALNNAQDTSSHLLETSITLLNLSESLLVAGSTANTEYVKAMLQLSKDIGTMADRILTMADKILIMSDKIGDMAERIVETQRVQSANVALTQENLLKAQKNFEQILNTL